MRRRDVLKSGFAGMGMVMTNHLYAGCRQPDVSVKGTSLIPELGPLGEPDANGVRLPEGFTSRIVAETSHEPVEGCGYKWHSAPDGGATFPTDDGGWIYVSNSEAGNSRGGVGSLRFDKNGKVVDAYSILSGTIRNCAGGPTPWGTWLSCEEYEQGRVWECDPFGKKEPVVYPLMGVYSHEAVTWDTKKQIFYLTEDQADGFLYRFIPASVNAQGIPDMTAGRLEYAGLHPGDSKKSFHVKWKEVPDPLAKEKPIRHTLKGKGTTFRGGEGIWYFNDVVYFVTKHDNRVWAYEVATQTIEIIYDDNDFKNPMLTGVDNVIVSPGGDVIVAEDGGDMQLVAITPERKLLPLMQVTGHQGSEICGPAFDPSHTRMYFSSQRGVKRKKRTGLTIEISGPFMG